MEFFGLNFGSGDFLGFASIYDLIRTSPSLLTRSTSHGGREGLGEGTQKSFIWGGGGGLPQGPNSYPYMYHFPYPFHGHGTIPMVPLSHTYSRSTLPFFIGSVRDILKGHFE